LAYVDSQVFPTQGVEEQSSLTMIVTGDWADLQILARQIKFAARWCTLVLIAGRKGTESMLVVSGESLDNPYALVEQRISEGFKVAFQFGKEFRWSCVYDFHEEPSDSSASREEIEGHPF